MDVCTHELNQVSQSTGFEWLRGKKPQDAQDDVTELFDLFDAHFWVGKVCRI